MVSHLIVLKLSVIWDNADTLTANLNASLVIQITLTVFVAMNRIVYLPSTQLQALKYSASSKSTLTVTPTLMLKRPYRMLSER